MKKLIAIVMVLAILFSCAGCNNFVLAGLWTIAAIEVAENDATSDSSYDDRFYTPGLPSIGSANMLPVSVCFDESMHGYSEEYGDTTIEWEWSVLYDGGVNPQVHLTAYMKNEVSDSIVMNLHKRVADNSCTFSFEDGAVWYTYIPNNLEIIDNRIITSGTVNRGRYDVNALYDDVEIDCDTYLDVVFDDHDEQGHAQNIHFMASGDQFEIKYKAMDAINSNWGTAERNLLNQMSQDMLVEWWYLFHATYQQLLFNQIMK